MGKTAQASETGFQITEDIAGDHHNPKNPEHRGVLLNFLCYESSWKPEQNSMKNSGQKHYYKYENITDKMFPVLHVDFFQLFPND